MAIFGPVVEGWHAVVRQGHGTVSSPVEPVPHNSEDHPVGENLDVQIRKLQEFYWSDADPEGRGFVSLAELYRRAGDYSEAHRLLRDGLARHGRLASGHVVLGWVYLDQGLSTEAEVAFRAALAVDPENLGALRGLGDLLLERDVAEEALAVHRKLHRLDPLAQDVPERIGVLEARVQALAESRGLGPREAGPDAPVWEDGAAVADSLDWEVASIQADRSSEPLEDEPEPHDSDRDEVDEGASPSAVLSPAQGKDSLVTRTMGEIYLRQGLLDEARRVFETLLEEDPENELLRTRLREVEAAGRGEDEGPDTLGSAEETAAEQVIPVRALGPDEIRSIEEMAPEGVIPISALAPEPVLPVAELAPDAIVPVADLAPNLVVSIGDLAPETVLPIQDLAPDGEGPDSTLEDFEAWLDRLP